jgi:hypothetical protein
MIIKNQYSKFWLKDNWNTESIFDTEEKNKSTTDLIALSSYRRAISNFVNIVTQKTIPVTFVTRGNSYTDKEKVIISANLNEKSFDYIVGLALHEGAHVKLSDFELLESLKDTVMAISPKYMSRGNEWGFLDWEVVNYVKLLLNFVEDKRIDYYIFSTSPGYKGYYHAMYNKYFNYKAIDKGLQSDEYTNESIESYFFRIINITNSNTRLNALNGLVDIWKILDFKNINRLKSSKDSLMLALKIYDIILDNIEKRKSDKKVDNFTSEGEDSCITTTLPSDFDDNSSSYEENGDNSNFDDAVDSAEEKKSNESTVILTDTQKNRLSTTFEKQKDFLGGQVTKKTLSKKMKNLIDVVEKSEVSYTEVAKDFKTNWRTNKRTRCIVVKQLNKDLVDSGTISIARENRWSEDDNNENIIEGLRLGTILGRKLQIRTESKEIKYSRKKYGAIDKRLLAELGFRNENIFNQILVDSYPDAFLHISVDASGSMCGDKWDKTMTAVTAIVKATDMIEGVDVVVSFRATQGSGTQTDMYPLILIGYDSRVDTLVKVKTLWQYLHPTGTTPEGLCYEAILEDMVKGTRNKKSYFLNFSDGMPTFSNQDLYYYDYEAIEHTKSMVHKIKKSGIDIISYFIGNSINSDHSKATDFKKMYGKDSQFIDVTSVTSVAKTINSRFLEK